MSRRQKKDWEDVRSLSLNKSILLPLHKVLLKFLIEDVNTLTIKFIVCTLCKNLSFFIIITVIGKEDKSWDSHNKFFVYGVILSL